MSIVTYLIGLYVVCGLEMAVAYMRYVGKLISRKYGCSLLDGIARFERAGTFEGNFKAIVVIVATWPTLLYAIFTGAWQRALTEMVDENDYSEGDR